MSESTKPRVAVVFGGRSSEHAVSCATAASVLAAIDRDRYDVIALGITENGRWVQASDRPDYSLGAGSLPHVEESDESVLVPLEATDRQLIEFAPGAVPETLGHVDVVFPLLHGPYGEDGTLQGLLELSDTRYVGAGVFASAASMDKHYMKVVLEAAGLRVGKYEVVTARQWRTEPDAVRTRIAGLGLPVYVKPARAGSSIGITKVTDSAHLDAAIDTAHRHDRKIVVEAGLDAREIECGVLSGFGDAGPETSLPGEIVVSGHDFYDFDAKYLDEAAIELKCPADLDDSTTAVVRATAADAFEAVGGEGLARVDMFVEPDGGVIVNELNTMPGFTPVSMFPRAWKASGLDYSALIDRLIRLALDRPTGLR